MQVKPVDLVFQTMLAELGQRSLDAAWTDDFPPEGRFTPVTVKGRRYWYFDLSKGLAARIRRYVGPADAPEIASKVEAFNRAKNNFQARRRMVSSLTREGGMVAPDRMSGDVVEALAAAGFFKLSGVLVGSVAFQTFSSVLGVRLPIATLLTGNTYVAQDYAMHQEFKGSIPTILDLLKAVEPSFRGVPHQSRVTDSSVFATDTDYRVEFLISKRYDYSHIVHPSQKSTRRGASAEPPHFLDFLIKDPVRTMLLHKSGIPVIVPDPCRYAVHKLILASCRHFDSENAVKRDKDIQQAALLFEAILVTRRASDLALVYHEAWERGPTWRQAIRLGADMLTSSDKALLIKALVAGASQNGEEIVLPF